MAKFLLLSALLVPTALAAAPPAPPLAPPAQFNCDALAIPGPLNRETLHDLEPAHSLDAAAAVLNRHGVKYQRARVTITSPALPAKALHDINTLPQGEPIILPVGSGSTICVLQPSAGSI